MLGLDLTPGLVPWLLLGVAPHAGIGIATKLVVDVLSAEIVLASQLCGLLALTLLLRAFGLAAEDDGIVALTGAAFERFGCFSAVAFAAFVRGIAVEFLARGLAAIGPRETLTLEAGLVVVFFLTLFAALAVAVGAVTKGGLAVDIFA